MRTFLEWLNDNNNNNGYFKCYLSREHIAQDEKKKIKFIAGQGQTASRKDVALVMGDAYYKLNNSLL